MNGRCWRVVGPLLTLCWRLVRSNSASLMTSRRQILDTRGGGAHFVSIGELADVTIMAGKSPVLTCRPSLVWIITPSMLMWLRRVNQVLHVSVVPSCSLNGEKFLMARSCTISCSFNVTVGR